MKRKPQLKKTVRRPPKKKRVTFTRKPQLKKTVRRPPIPKDGFIVKSTVIRTLKRPPKKKRVTFTRTKNNVFKSRITHRSGKVFESTYRIVTTKSDIEAVLDVEFKAFSKKKGRADLTQSVQKVNAKKIQWKRGHFQIEGETSRAAHVKSVTRKRDKKKLRREYYDNRTEMEDEVIRIENEYRVTITKDKKGRWLVRRFEQQVGKFRQISKERAVELRSMRLGKD